MTEEIVPQWVIVDGKPRHVSDFKDLLPPFRPEAICPLCKNPVILKLGDERIHHYAHHPDIVCAATQPETALHLNTKYHIYEQLLSGEKLYLEQRCSNGCGRSRNVVWIGNWKRVEIESQIGSFRPDILIIGSDETINAIEVMVTHQVEDDKGDFYRMRGIGCLEIDACESIYEGDSPWKIEQPIPFAVCISPLTEWTCDKCREQLRKYKERELREQREIEYRQHNYSKILYAKLVDYYYPTGRKYRETYYLMKVVHNDKLGVLVRNQKNEVLWRYNGEVTEELLETAFDAPKRELERRCKAGAITHDREWVPWVPGKKFVARDTQKYPFLYVWDIRAKKWLKVSVKKQVNQEPQILFSWDTYPKETRIPLQDMVKIIGKEGFCIHCGQRTSDWWYFDCATRECRCRKCFREGKY